MPNPMIKIHNLQTGEEIERPMTKEEYAAHLADIEATAGLRAEEAEKVAQRNALFERLGLTSEEAALLLG
jgi:hypothetical protein